MTNGKWHKIATKMHLANVKFLSQALIITFVFECCEKN